jgi:hypothetical protein
MFLGRRRNVVGVVFRVVWAVILQRRIHTGACIGNARRSDGSGRCHVFLRARVLGRTWNGLLGRVFHCWFRDLGWIINTPLGQVFPIVTLVFDSTEMVFDFPDEVVYLFSLVVLGGDRACSGSLQGD